MKKIFNRAKWERIQERRSALQAARERTSNEWHEARETFQRTFGIFQHDFSNTGHVDKSHLHLFDVIRNDGKLTLLELDEHLSTMTTDWPQAAARLNVPAAFVGKDRIKKLYSQLRESKKLQESSERASEAANRFGTSFNVLNEFSSKFNLDQREVACAAPNAPTSNYDPAYTGEPNGGFI